jgi:NADPH-dependent 2,4-dienoyl-CoA reductase/sulfur reductase-like enzyme
MARRLVVIGGDAGGMAAATQARRRDDDLEIVALERGNWTSYSACGIPYVVGGAVADLDQLVVRTPDEFRQRSRIDVRMHHEAMAIDLVAGKVEVRDHVHERTIRLPFDDLVLGTGARPLRPDLPGIDLPFVHGVQTLDDAADLLAHADKIRCREVVIVGSGYIGLEMAEAFVARGARVTLVEGANQVMRSLDRDMAGLVQAALERFGVDVRLDSPAKAFEDGTVVTEEGQFAADLVVLGLGVVPNSELAADAGIELGVRNSIRVDRRQQTSAAGVWAAGDSCESYHLVSRRPVHIALGTVTNRQARVAGINIGGGYATFPGVVGTAVTKICNTEVGRTGLSEQEADEAGLATVSAKIDSTTRAGYFPGNKPITVKLVAERVTGRLLGAQIVGEEGAAKRIDIAAVAITAGMTVHELIDVDLSYAPPFSPVWDPVATAARQAARAVDEAR